MFRAAVRLMLGGTRSCAPSLCCCNPASISLSLKNRTMLDRPAGAPYPMLASPF